MRAKLSGKSLGPAEVRRPERRPNQPRRGILRQGSTQLRDRLVGLAALAVFIGVWEAVGYFGFVEPLFLPAPSRIFRRAMIMISHGDFTIHILASSRRVLVGFTVSSLIAVPVGIVLGSSRVARAAFDPFLSILRPLPSMSWIPLSLLWLGITESQKYSIVFMGSFASTTLYTLEATRQIDPVLVRAAQNLGASRLAVMRYVVLPGAMPSILAGLKVMLGVAWTTVISAELVAAQQGLGFLIMNGKEYFKTDQVLLGMVLISLTVMVLDAVFGGIERRLTPWREG